MEMITCKQFTIPNRQLVISLPRGLGVTIQHVGNCTYCRVGYRVGERAQYVNANPTDTISVTKVLLKAHQEMLVAAEEGNYPKIFHRSRRNRKSSGTKYSHIVKGVSAKGKVTLRYSYPTVSGMVTVRNTTTEDALDDHVERINIAVSDMTSQFWGVWKGLIKRNIDILKWVIKDYD